MSELSTAFGEMLKAGNLTTNNKRWITERMHEIQAHERNNEVIRALGNNPQLPWIIMFLGGTATAGAVELIEKWRYANSTGDTKAKKTIEQELATVIEPFLDISSFLTGGIGMWYLQENLVGQKLKAIIDDSPPKSWIDIAAVGIKSTSVGIAATSLVMLTLMCVFGGSSKDGGMQSLAGLAAIV